MATDSIFAKLEQSPKLSIYVDHWQRVLASERVRRKRFQDEIRADQKAEFINGEAIVHSPAAWRHTKAGHHLANLLSLYARKHGLGEVGTEKVMISLTRNDYEPDVLFFGQEKAKKFKPEQCQFPAPDFIAEVLSPSTEKNDRGIKFEDYAAHGVREYWIIDSKKQVLEQYVLKGESYELALKSKSGEVSSVAVAGFTIPIRALFDGDENLRTAQAILSGR